MNGARSPLSACQAGSKGKRLIRSFAVFCRSAGDGPLRSMARQVGYMGEFGAQPSVKQRYGRIVLLRFPWLLFVRGTKGGIEVFVIPLVSQHLSLAHAELQVYRYRFTVLHRKLIDVWLLAVSHRHHLINATFISRVVRNRGCG